MAKKQPQHGIDRLHDVYPYEHYYLREIQSVSDELHTHLDSALHDFVDSFDHDECERIRENITHNLDQAFYLLNDLQALLEDQDKIKQLNHERLLEMIRG